MIKFKYNDAFIFINAEHIVSVEQGEDNVDMYLIIETTKSTFHFEESEAVSAYETFLKNAVIRNMSDE